MKKILFILLILSSITFAQRMEHTISKINLLHQYTDSLNSILSVSEDSLVINGYLLVNSNVNITGVITNIPTSKTYIMGSSDVSIGGGDYATHDSLVEVSFILGYESVGVTWEGNINQLGTGGFYSQYIIGVANGSKMYVRSVADMEYSLNWSEINYPDLDVVMPAGSNSYIRVWNSTTNGGLQSIISTGASISDTNTTGYDVEFISIDPLNLVPASSFSNGYIAGQLMALADSLDVSVWTVRYLARQHGLTWTQDNGYGKIVPDSIFNNYDYTIDYDTLDIYDNKPNISPVYVYLNWQANNGLNYGAVGINGLGIEVDTMWFSQTAFYIKFKGMINQFKGGGWQGKVLSTSLEVFDGSYQKALIQTTGLTLLNDANGGSKLYAQIIPIKISDGSTFTNITKIRYLELRIIFFDLAVSGGQSWYYEW